MTCIIGLKDGGDIYIGADSLGSTSYLKRQITTPKVFMVGDHLIGGTGSWRMLQLLQYSLKVPEQDCEDDLQHLVTNFVPAIRELFKEHGYSRIENNEEKGGTFLLGYNSNLYSIESNFQITEHLELYDATGSGEEVALGAMGALIDNLMLTPEQKITKALELAAKYSKGVGGPFHIRKLPYGK
jgi:ATP-dependent protease HslVU (ClpYQ) peptidase subunit